MINSVRNTVLAILNKENFGYLSPSDFNLYAYQAQLEIFQNYFSDFNKQINLENQRRSGTEYANLSKKLAENIENFSVSNFLTEYNYLTGFSVVKYTNKFYVPSLVTTGDIAYTYAKILTYTETLASGTNTQGFISNQLINSAGAFLSKGIYPNDIVLNVTKQTMTIVDRVVNNTTILLIDDIFPLAPDSYIIISARSPREADKVSQNKITSLITSDITAPSNTFPAYTLEGQYLTLYPDTIIYKGMVQAQYYRYPLAPKWTYVTLVGGTPSFDQSASDYQDFEIPADEEVELVIKICQFAGVSIREEEVVQFAKREQMENDQQANGQ